MCPQRRALEKRFRQIKGARRIRRYAGAIGVFVALAVLSTGVFASGVLQNSLFPGDAIEVTKNGAPLSFVNRPYVENGVLYLPLRETLNLFGISEDGMTDISYQDGSLTLDLVLKDSIQRDSAGNIIKYQGIYVQIEVGSTTVWQPDGVTSELTTPPVLKDGITYVPAEFIYLLAQSHPYLNSFQARYHINDHEGINMAGNTLIYNGENLKNPASVLTSFFDAFSRREFDNMKTYCTPACVDQFFGDGYVFGMQQASLKSMLRYTDERMEGESTVIMDITANIVAAPSAVFGDITEFGCFIFLQKQPDGTYRISEFASGV